MKYKFEIYKHIKLVVLICLSSLSSLAQDIKPSSEISNCRLKTLSNNKEYIVSTSEDYDSTLIGFFFQHQELFKNDSLVISQHVLPQRWIEETLISITVFSLDKVSCKLVKRRFSNLEVIDSSYKCVAIHISFENDSCIFKNVASRTEVERIKIEPALLDRFSYYYRELGIK